MIFLPYIYCRGREKKNATIKFICRFLANNPKISVLTTRTFFTYAEYMQNIHKYWGGILVRGIVALLFGLVALFMPGLGLALMILFFGAFSLVDGVIAFFVGLFARSFALVFEGIVGVLVGLFIFFYTPQAVII